MGSKQLCLSHFGAKNLFYRLYFGKTSYNDLVFARNEFLRIVGPPNESLILIVIYYMFKYSFGEINNFARVTSEPKRPVKGSIWAKLVIRT